MLDIESYIKFINLTARKKELKELSKDVQEQLDILEKPLIEQLIESPMDKLCMQGKTVFLKDVVVAKISDKDQAIALLKADGFTEYISEKYNYNSISKLVRDQLDEFGEVPESFGEVIKPLTITRLGVNAG